MALAAQKAFLATPPTRVCRAAPVKALPNAEKIQLAAASAAVAIVLSASTAFAGVILENQPQVKKAFQSSGETVVKKSAVAKSPEEKAKKVESESSSSDLNVQSLWPLGVIASGGAMFAISKVDSGFANILDNVAVKDSNVIGLGTEDNLKNPGGYVAPYYEEKGAVAVGTKALKKVKK